MKRFILYIVVFGLGLNTYAQTDKNDSETIALITPVFISEYEFQISTEGKVKLDSLCSELSSQKLNKLEVHGYHYYERGVSQIRSQKKAEEVLEYIMDKGLSAENMLSYGHNTMDKDANAYDRSRIIGVEIIYELLNE